jgi:hypothetical protein
MDKMTRVIWTELTPGGTTGLTHAESQKACLDLSFANYTDWRLPDQNELIQAFINTIGGLETTYTGFGSTNNVTWSSTSRSNATIGWQGTKESWHMNLYTMAADYTDRTNTTRNYRCVRDAN